MKPKVACFRKSIKLVNFQAAWLKRKKKKKERVTKVAIIKNERGDTNRF